MTDFEHCLSYALEKMQINFTLTHQQVEALRNLFNCVNTLSKGTLHSFQVCTADNWPSHNETPHTQVYNHTPERKEFHN